MDPSPSSSSSSASKAVSSASGAGRKNRAQRWKTLAENAAAVAEIEDARIHKKESAREANAATAQKLAGGDIDLKASEASSVSNDSLAHKASVDRADFENHCVVCTDEAEDWAISDCNHIVCANCSHRMRYLYKDTVCVMCKSKVKKVVVTTKTSRNFDEFDLKTLHYDKQVDTYYTDIITANRFKAFRSLQCPVCFREDENSLDISSAFESMKNLHLHVRDAHQRVLCDICVAFRKCYVCEQDVFASDHINKGGKHGASGQPSAAVAPKIDSGKDQTIKKHVREAHPLCQYCRKHFFDDDALYGHLQKSHDSCFICERNGILYQYFRNYASLENHYRKEHYMCESPDCQGIVYDSAVDLQVHNRERHSSDAARSHGRIQLNLADFYTEGSSASSAGQNTGNHGRSRGGQGGSGRSGGQIQERRRRMFHARDVVYTDGSSGGNHHQRLAESSTAAASPDTHSAARPDEIDASAVEVAPPESSGLFEGFAVFLPPVNEVELRQRREKLARLMRTYSDPVGFQRFNDIFSQYLDNQVGPEVVVDEALAAFAEEAVGPILSERTALLANAEMRDRLALVAMRKLKPVPEDQRDSRMEFQQDSAVHRPESFPSLSAVTSDHVLSSRVLAVDSRYHPGSQAPSSRDFPSLSVGAPSRAAAPSSFGSNSTANAAPSVGATVPSIPGSAKWNDANYGSRADLMNAKNDLEAFPTLGGSSSGDKVNADPGLRLGSVWGKTSSKQTHKGKTPAPAPDLSSLKGEVSSSMSESGTSSSSSTVSANTFRSLRETNFPSISSASGSSSSQPANSGAVQVGRSQPSAGRSVVVDIKQVQKERQERVARSAVPRIGNSGLPWEAQKNAKKTQELKKEFQGGK